MGRKGWLRGSMHFGGYNGGEGGDWRVLGEKWSVCLHNGVQHCWRGMVYEHGCARSG